VLRVGASVGEIYSAFIYRGPLTAALISAELLEAMAEQSIASVAALRGRGMTRVG
jgi:dihydroorotate dehydrogenase